MQKAFGKIYQSDVIIIFNFTFPFSVAITSPHQLESMQENHGGFNAKMLEATNLIGEVHRLTSNGDVRVQYPGEPASSYRWTVSTFKL